MNTDKGKDFINMKIWIFVSLSVVLCLTMVGCRSFETHPWTSPDNAKKFYVEPPVKEEDRLYVKPDHLYRPIVDQMSVAERVLSESSFVPLTWDQFEEFTGVDRISEDGAQPYLIRAVAWSNPPWYTLVFFDQTTGILYTEQVTYNGEIYFPGDYRSFPLPVIALLNRAPADAKAYAIWGGDGALAHWGSPQAWIED